ncbi:META domain-containing protein [Aliarcobacter lanthieri]|uniref:META domain-containing protein n=1 Tax=Aliarcobacter lanthieri TaxID=1355374 RepID=UPI00047C3648|nr:META domain-containing protein [Aliarcobacter lanthieri]QKF58383.1 META domain-containing protein [Aliarcobacter lanthieri]
MIKKSFLNIFLITVISTIFLTACSTKQNELEDMKTLKNTKWKALVLNNVEVNNNIKVANINFEEDGRVFGNLGCNNFFSSFKEDNGKLTLAQAGSTMMMCSDMTTEHNFLNVISTVKSYEINGKTLRLFDKNNNEIAKFVKE